MVEIAFISNPHDPGTRGYFELTAYGGNVPYVHHYNASGAIKQLKECHRHERMLFKGIDWLGPEAVYHAMRQAEAADLEIYKQWERGGAT